MENQNNFFTFTTMRPHLYLLLALLCSLFSACTQQPVHPEKIQGWNILSKSREDALITISAAKDYNINHLQLSHKIIMNLREIRNTDKRELVNELVAKAHASGIKEVVLWDHTLYKLDYYPDEFRTGPKGTIDLDNPVFWEWFKNDYRGMLNLIPDVNGIVLTITESGAPAEKQYSEKLKSEPEKLAAVIEAIAQVVCSEYKKKLYLRTFAYTEAEYNNLIGCMSHIKNQDIILMMKETPHDFFLTHPNDKYAGTINRPTIIEFDAGNEFNGQGVIANTWPDYVIGRWSKYITLPNIIGYVARTDRYGDTRLIGTPNEILLEALKSYTADTTTTAEMVYDNFITRKYGSGALKYLKPAFKMSFDIVTSSLYTLGTNTANHSALNYDPYRSSYARHVSGKWMDNPTIYIAHDVNKEFHYWKDVINHIAPPRYKQADGPIRREAPHVIDSAWVQPEELINEEYLSYIIAEKSYGVNQAEKALVLIRQSKDALAEEDYITLYDLFERTLLTARLHEAVATAYWGYRVYAQSPKSCSPWFIKTVDEALTYILAASKAMEQYDKSVPAGHWKWKKDTDMAKKYYDLIVNGWPEYNNVKFNRR